MIPDSTKKIPEFRDPDCPTWDEVCTSWWFTFSRGIVYVIEILCIRRIRKVIVISQEGRKIDSVVCNSPKDVKIEDNLERRLRFLVAPFSMNNR